MPERGPQYKPPRAGETPALSVEKAGLRHGAELDFYPRSLGSIPGSSSNEHARLFIAGHILELDFYTMIVSHQSPEVNGNDTDRALSRLTPRHLADLRKSGLSDQQITRCGFHSLRVPQTVQTILRRKCGIDVGDCLAFPFFDADGKALAYVRLKPDKPRTAKKDGKIVKYESPVGLPNHAYFPPGTLAALKDQLTPLLITEGEKKAAKADQEGFPCVGLVGIWGWPKTRAKDKDGTPQGDRELIDGLALIAWQGRLVLVVFDSDAATKPSVRAAEWHLAETLQRLGAVVRVVRLPQGDPGPDGTPAKIGLDDFLVAHGPDAFRELMAGAVEPTPPEKGLQPNEAPDDPHRLARLFIGESCQHAEGLTLRFWREEFHRWDGSAYRIVPEKELRAELTASAKAELDRVNLKAQILAARDDKPPPTVRKVTSRLTADVAHALASLTVLPSRTEAPAWLQEDSPFPASETLACPNGLINLASLVAGKNHFAPPTPRFFSGNCLAFDFNIQAPAPAAWLGFLAGLWPDDPQSIGTLQEWMGYLLTPDTRQQKILLLVGPKRSGKGTIGRVIRGLVGADNVACPTLSSLGTNFGLWPLLGKTVAMIQDARLSGRTDAATVAERLLSISGEDAQTIDRKFLPPVTAKLFARFMLLTNELPKLNDSSGALPGRMILLRLTKSWYGIEDTALTDRLLAELPGILLWTIAGWQRLRERGRFVQPDAGKGMVGDLADLASPIGAFVRDCCKVGPGCQIEKAALYNRWKQWCDEQGRDHPGDAATFGRNLFAAVPSLGDAYPRSDGGRVHVYEGICLKSSVWCRVDLEPSHCI
jgi:putative DNA primase/helicase